MDSIGCPDIWRPLSPWSSPPLEPALLAPQLGVGDLGLITGSPGVGKTSVALSIAVGMTTPSLATATCGGAFVPNADQFGNGVVTIVDGENDEHRWNAAIRRYFEAASVSEADYGGSIHHADPVALKVGVPAPEDSKIRTAVKQLAENGTRLIITDSAVPVFRPGDINSPIWVNTKLVPFRAACREFGITAIVLCHVARTPQGQPQGPVVPLGTTMQEAVADTLIHLRRTPQKDGDGIDIVHCKSRRAFWIRRGAVVRAHFVPGGRYECKNPRASWPLEPDPTGSAVVLTERQQSVLDTLQRCHPGSSSAKELAQRLDSSPDAVGDHLTALLNHGLVEKIGRGPGTRWKYAEPERVDL